MSSDRRWVAVVPVKELPLAKTRLAVPAATRQDLALAMACDVVSACLASGSVAATVVVTNDARAAAALGELGAAVVADSSDAGLNRALVDGARHGTGWYPRAGVLAVSSDLPSLAAGTLDEILAAAGDSATAVVTDSSGTGTTLLVARTADDFKPGFGPGSRNRHVLAGATELDPTRWPGARCDVDTLDDLRRAAALGLGPRTAEAAARLAVLAV